jgi:RimJ/RimL family protein N-acetyltransferase
VVALATRVPDPHWRDVLLLDVFAHPTADATALADLLRALPPQEGKTLCYADPRDTAKIGALEQEGFRQEAVLSRQFREGEAWRDALMYSRREA